MVDALARGQAHFGDENPDAEQLEAWGKGLLVEAPHLFPPAQPTIPAGLHLSTEERLTRGRSPGPDKYRMPTVTKPEHLAELATITSPTARLTRAPELLAEQEQ